jgi:mannitol-specific phosphotransferase system IIBC component
MLGHVLEALTGSGLAASAGLNAYIPLLTMGLLARYTDLIELPSGWSWLGNGWVIAILAVLLTVEFFADKIPVVDSVNDVVQTVVRPTAGGLAFGAGSSSETVTVSDPGHFFSSNEWVPVVVGMLIALGVHGVKAAARPVINAGTAGVGAPVASTAEDATSIFMSLIAIVLPFLVLFFLVAMVLTFVWVFRRRRERRRERKAARAAGFRV